MFLNTSRSTFHSTSRNTGLIPIGGTITRTLERGIGMANGTSSIASAISSALGALTPGQLFQLGRHLTQSQEMQALQILTTMQANPALAPSLLPSLSTVQNLPPQVMTWVTSALSNPANFQSDMSQAVAALQAAATHTGVLGNLGL